ncbi:hypothetical protein BDV26DRAFT_73512 [Aspergillus bertholletiae]|uniref:Uncharacterized protein n=1 Tax=Aspergillus bertholletiae TaxID=1226010 RepID=A0A5N7ATM6_9EURO|nr:hypothetical protein BDV26DRAFT_73512 [Aspergillus bertholletiae]
MGRSNFNLFQGFCGCQEHLRPLLISFGLDILRFQSRDNYIISQDSYCFCWTVETTPASKWILLSIPLRKPAIGAAVRVPDFGQIVPSPMKLLQS